MKTQFYRLFSLSLAAALLCLGGLSTDARAQARIDSLRRAYDFQGAVDLCERMMRVTDSTRLGPLEEEMILSRNGLAMTRYCSQPEVVAKYHFPIDEFFLYYPMQDRSWRRVPNILDSLARGGLVQAMYVPEGAREIYYSAQDADGIRNLYRTAQKDSVLWTEPRLINEDITSSSDEIYPYLSADGKSLYFASRGLYGMGGYDLYVSRWNETALDWDAPVNLGFPYSSPYDDFLYAHSEDGQYTVFASNRECGPDSVCVYVLAYDNMPIRKEVPTVDGLKALCALTPPEEGSGAGRPARQDMQEDGNVRRYIDAMDRVRLIRDSIARFSAALDAKRAALKTEADAARLTRLREEILDGEIALPARQKQLNEALRDLQRIEMDFLSEGIVIDPDRLRAEADREMIGTASHYIFSKKEWGPALQMKVERPVPTFDYSFKILDVGQFAEDNTLPDGLVYQIQLFASSRKVSERELKGLSPVFERTGAGGKRVYSVGVFRSYSDVLSRLNKVKSRGFKGAMITAFRNGKMVSVPEARKLESTLSRQYKVQVWPSDGQSLPEAALDVIHAMCDKDIIRTREGAALVYEVGPFPDRSECAALVTALQDTGAVRASVSEIHADSE